jgi:hypothetical protein
VFGLPICDIVLWHALGICTLRWLVLTGWGGYGVCDENIKVKSVLGIRQSQNMKINDIQNDDLSVFCRS